MTRTLDTKIAIGVEQAEPGLVMVFCNPEADGLVSGGNFKSKRQAERHAASEAKRLKSLGYKNVTWCANYA